MLRTGISVVRNAISNKKTSFNAVSLKAWRAFSTEETVKITYVDKEGVEHVVDAPIGKDLMTIAHDNEIDLEGIVLPDSFYVLKRSFIFKLLSDSIYASKSLHFKSFSKPCLLL